ncbi:M23 family metallopeptidase [Marinibacterium profundimaris]|uniref:Peptidase M23 n=1 Tax=Marinibacterium profundimaris TaxID=1679460 RepID=A0A225NRB7_9RHOB|nr:M23 family metallopeptidase [Marinibacterium profundimaris]OWU77494.1 peptidase M23 [Marinibacterium profundimaris]
MQKRLAVKLNRVVEPWFPERRVFLKSDTDTRFIRLRPVTQLAAYTVGGTVLCWAILASAIVVMDSLGAGSYREQAKRDLETYSERLDALADQRDARADEALAAQERFNAALVQISSMQSELLASETRRLELETGIEVIQSTLRDTMKDREAARDQLATLEAEMADENRMPATAAGDGAPTELLAEALDRTARERDQIRADAAQALIRADDLERELDLLQDRNDQIFRQIEEAMSISVEPLDKMFRAAGLPPERLIDQVRRGYSGQGGPLTPLSFSTRGEQPSPDEIRANRALQQMDQLNLYRIAASKAPFASPVKDAFRFTSGYGYRRDPKTGGRRMHKGVDFAASSGTPIYATGEGVVTEAGWSSGYGRMVVVRHDFGIETRYAHMSKIRAKVGQRVSRGDRIGDMGASGRVTGVHLHYEVRVNGAPVNPMTYIKAAKNVF